jgi:hypothetical protein
MAQSLIMHRTNFTSALLWAQKNACAIKFFKKTENKTTKTYQCIKIAFGDAIVS